MPCRWLCDLAPARPCSMWRINMSALWPLVCLCPRRSSPTCPNLLSLSVRNVGQPLLCRCMPRITAGHAAPNSPLPPRNVDIHCSVAVSTVTLQTHDDMSALWRLVCLCLLLHPTSHCRSRCWTPCASRGPSRCLRGRSAAMICSTLAGCTFSSLTPGWPWTSAQTRHSRRRASTGTLCG